MKILSVNNKKICILNKNEFNGLNKLSKHRFSTMHLLSIKDLIRFAAKSEIKYKDLYAAFYVSDDNILNLAAFMMGSVLETIELHKSFEKPEKNKKLEEQKKSVEELGLSTLTLPNPEGRISLSSEKMKCYQKFCEKSTPSDKKRNAINLLLKAYGKDAKELCFRICCSDETLKKDKVLMTTIKKTK